MPALRRKSDEILHLLQLACARRELLILATPYLRYESTFLAIQDGEVHVLATMSREDAQYGLRSGGLKIRFPHGLGFFEAEVEARGMGMVEGRRTLRLSLPRQLKESDQRVAYRVEQVGRVTLTFTSRRQDLLTATLTDLSTTGARFHTSRDVRPEDLEVGDRILLTVPLEEELRFDTPALVRHMSLRTLGVEFQPPLPEAVLQPLSRWVFLRREEARERLASRLELAPVASRPAPGIPSRGIILAGSDETMAAEVRAALGPDQPFAQVPLALQPLKDALQVQPELLIVHIPGLGLDFRRRLKPLLELVHGHTPVLLLGTDVDGADLFDLAGELRASSALVWSTSRAVFLERLVRGIIRRHKGLDDGPFAPQEA